jgi:mono/diheme cytochrome c family protein
MKVVTCLVSITLCGSGIAQAQLAPAAPAPVDSGAATYQKWCVECHNARGLGTLYLQKRYKGSVPSILDQRQDLKSEYVSYIVRNGISFMPSFRRTEISNQELAALSAYLASDPTLRTRDH